MSDDEFERYLTNRLSAYESRIPDMPAPHLRAHRPRSDVGWPILLAGGASAVAALALALAAAVLLNAIPSNVGDASPTPSVDGNPSIGASASPAATPSTEPPASVDPSASPAATPSTKPPASVDSSPSATVKPVSAWQEAAMFGGDGSIETAQSVTRTADGFVAVGTHYGVESMPVFGPVPQEGRVWHSPDGRSWEDVTPPNTFADTDLTQIFASADGTLIALGGLAEGEFGDERLMAWESADGRARNPASLGLPDGSTVNDIGSGARGYLAMVFTAGQRDLWLSADGRAWEMVRAGGPIDAQADNFSGIGAGDEGFVALGTRGEGDVVETFAIASPNGRQWIEASVPPDALVVTAQGGDWYASGRFPYGSLADPADDRVWFSANGLEWNAIGSIPLNPIFPDADEDMLCSDSVRDLHAAGPWLVSSASAAGLCSEGRVVTYGTQHISRGGQSWGALPFPAATVFGGSTPGSHGSSVSGALVQNEMLILVGQSGNRAAFWFNEAP